MLQWLLFIHLLGAVGMGFYLLFPFLAGKIGSSATGPASAGFVRALNGFNRIAQYLIILQFLTGGYLVGKGDYSPAWMAAAIVLVIAVGALTGIMGVNLKRLQHALEESKPGEVFVGKVKVFAWIVAILFLIILILMYKPNLL